MATPDDTILHYYHCPYWYFTRLISQLRLPKCLPHIVLVLVHAANIALFSARGGTISILVDQQNR
jgi:hypothetical protein